MFPDRGVIKQRLGRNYYSEGHNEDHRVGRTHHTEIKDRVTGSFLFLTVTGRVTVRH